MRKLVGTCLLCCLWSAPAWACFDESGSSSTETKPQEESSAPLPDLAANKPGVNSLAGTNRSSQTDWATAGLGTTGVATLLAALVLAGSRRRRQLSSRESNEKATQETASEG